jgi:SAM-dependent methyltransferase
MTVVDSSGAVPDAIFSAPRLAGIYDALDPERTDLEAYLTIAGELGARSVLDIGCGTGTFACLLAARGLDVIGTDPAAPSIEVARRKAGAERVRWLVGDATELPPTEADLVTMTGNAAQVLLTDESFLATLRAAHDRLRPGGQFVFEVRDPSRRAWLRWNREQTFRRVEIEGVGWLETWTELTDVGLPFVSFRMTFAFEADGEVLTSDSTLRFREREEVVGALREAGFVSWEVRDAPDRPGLEFVFVATRPQER